MRAAALALAALVVATAPLSLAQPERSAPRGEDRVEPLAALPGLPAGWTPLLGLDDSRLPPIPSVLALGPAGLCDLTADLAGFARVAGLDAPEDLARLAVASAWPDQLGVPEVVALDVAAGIATAQTFSARDGVAADWVVDLASLQADFVVRSVLGGNADAEHGFEGWHVWEGLDSRDLRAQENGLLVTKTLLQPLPDGDQFRLTYFTQFYSSEAQADQYARDYAAAALAIWTIQVDGWGFVSADPDGTYDITMDGCSCIFSGFNVNIHVHAKLESLFNLFNPPLAYPSNQHFYRIVIGHEFHHHLQYSINQWKLGGVLTEGGARFSETIFEPEGAHGPRTIQYLPNINGFSNVMLRPNNALNQRAYDFGLFWGFLYSQDGGIALLKEVYKASADEGAGSPNELLPGVIAQALLAIHQASPGAAKHVTMNDAMGDFAAAMAAKSFPWTPPSGGPARDWGLYLPAAARIPASGAGGAYVASLSPEVGGVQLASFPDGAAAAGAGAATLPAVGRWAWSDPAGAQNSLLPAVALAGGTGLVYAAANGGLPVGRRGADPGAGFAAATVVVV